MYVLIWIFVLLKVCTCYQPLLFSTPKDIRIVNSGKPRKVQVLVKDLQNAVAVDYLYNDSLICWTDHSLEEIDCITYNGTHTSNRTIYAKSGVPYPDGLACDWLTRKLYWTDMETKKIEVVSLRTKYRKVLFWQDIDQPRGIAVDPFHGVLFWTDWGEIPKIERASMNGNLNTRKIIISDGIFWPNSISLDIIRKKLYWIDGRIQKIEVTDYDGKNRNILVQKGMQYPYALTYVNDVFYWTDWKTHTIESANYTAGVSPSEFLRLNDSPIMDIEAWDPSHQPYKWTPCEANNGDCSHLCLLSSEPPGYSCACPTGIKLVNETTCAINVEQFLLLVQRTEISKISLDTPDHTYIKLPLKGIKHAIGIDYDPVEEYFYWTDEELKNIRRAKLDGSKQENVISYDIFNPDGIAVDWIARNIYWSDTGANRIEVFRMNTNFRKAIIVEDLEEPRAIVLSPQHGWLFWSDWNERSPKIERSDLDGSNRLVIVSKDISWPNGIALDFENNKVYWADAKTDKIEVVNMDGRDRREVLGEDLPHVFGLTLLGNYLYWTDWQRRTVERVNKVTSLERYLILDQLPDLMGVKAVNKSANFRLNPCAYNNGDCAQFCFNKPNQRPVCSCQIEYELGTDNKSCIEPEAFLMIYNNNNICRVSVQNSFSHIIPITGIKSISAFDVDINDKRLYWADNKAKTINRSFLNGSLVERIVEFGVSSPESLAIDWLSSNLYWADAGSKRIEVTKLNGQYRRILFWKNLQEPRNLVLDPRVGYMYWSEWDGINGAIFKASMDGFNRSIFISDIGRVHGLTIDYAQRFLYWTQLKNDVTAIELCDTEGRNRKQIANFRNFKPMSITQYQEFIFWTNWRNGSIMRANKYTGMDTKILYSQREEISDLRIIHSSKQKGWNACVDNNGGCKNLCLIRPVTSEPSTKRTCTCPTHYIMRDGNCYTPENFLLFSQKNSINHLVADTDECPDVPLPIPGLKAIRAIEYDPVTKFFYWIDGKAQAIKRSYENGSYSTVVVSGNHNGKSFHFHDIAYEPYNRLLFWSCSATDTINVTRLSNSSVGEFFKVMSGEKPRNIALHAEKALLFWTDVGNIPRIVRSQLDGTGRMNIETDGIYVESIAIDRKNDLLFYVCEQEILRSDLFGKSKTSIASMHSKRVTNLAVTDTFLYYWIEYKDSQQNIERINKLSGKNKSTIVKHVLVTDLIAVTFLDERAFVEHPCSETYHHRNCSYFCIRSGFDNASCSCPVGMIRSPDRNGCSNQPTCGKDHFMCRQSPGECYPLGWKCDGTIDCPDGSDEDDCASNRCEYQFKCHSGSCVQSTKVCDGVRNCADGSDELGCCTEEFLSLGAYFMCRSDGKCILRTAVCDGWEQCVDGSDESMCPSEHVKNDNYMEDSSSTVVMLALLLIVIFLVVIIIIGFRCKKRLKRSVNANEHDIAALRPLAPGICPQGTLTTLGSRSRSIPHWVMNGGGSTGSYDRSHITGASSSTSMNNCPLNPPPSPATTILREECCCNQYSPPPPTPCSTDVCDESDANYSIYKADYYLCAPPPTPLSNSSDPPSI